MRSQNKALVKKDPIHPSYHPLSKFINCFILKTSLIETKSVRCVEMVVYHCLKYLQILCQTLSLPVSLFHQDDVLPGGEDPGDLPSVIPIYLAFLPGRASSGVDYRLFH